MKRALIFVFLLSAIRLHAQPVLVSGLRCNNRINPAGVDELCPALSWQLLSSQRNVYQSAYQIIVADDSALLQKDTGNIWDTKKVLSGFSIAVSYAGPRLQAGKVYFWKVKIWDARGKASPWSLCSHWQMGLLTAADWGGAKWIAFDTLSEGSAGGDVLPLLRRTFIVHKGLRTATMYMSGLGQFEFRLNGEKFGDHFLDPGWTKYDKHALYVCFDLTGRLREGPNALGVALGNGFYYIPDERYHKIRTAFGYPKMICRLVLQYRDGTIEQVVSDGSWKTAASPVTFSSIYGGEDYDARLEQAGWDQPVFNDRSWRPVIVTTGPPELNDQEADPLKIFEHFSPVRITQPKPGVWVYDLGQNASGIPELQVTGKKGSVLRMTPAELLDDRGMATQSAIGQPVWFSYTLKGEGKETWHPKFMYYGFRYIQVEGGVPLGRPDPGGLPVIGKLEALHTRNAAPKTGNFACSDTLFNRIFRLIDWAIQSNTASIFTDCPHREKLGWLEEAHLVGSSIRYNYDISNLLRKVVRDIIRAQTADGLIPDIAPEYVRFDDGFRDSPEWGSSGILLPWYAYKWYGDRQILEESYGMMSRYAAYLKKKASGYLLTFGLGDWYDIGPQPPGYSQLTPEGLTATAMYYYDLQILSRVALLLDKSDDASMYSEEGRLVRKSFNQAFFHPDTRQYGTGSQTANAMAVYMGLVDPADKPAVIDNIVHDIRDHHNSLTSGDIGYRYLLRVLDDAGRSDVIYDMNSRMDVPGYGYQLARGATALTESWQASRDASNDHFMLGHLMEWFYAGLGGIRPDTGSVAFNRIVIRPEPVGHIHYVRTGYSSPYGRIATEWWRKGKMFYMKVVIPGNTTATIYLPASPSSVVTEGGHALKDLAGMARIGYSGTRYVLRVGSGSYLFRVDGQEVAQ